MKTGDIFYLTAISMDGMDEITTPMPIMALQDGDPMEMIKAASIEYCRTRQGLADYDGNGRNFDLADFWYQVPNALCVKHGFKKLDSGDAATESADEPLFQLEDLALTENLLEDVYNELTAGPADELEDMLVLCGYDGDLELLQNGTEAEIEATIREYISCAHNDAARTDILEYWMDHCASIYAGCGDGTEGITEATHQKPQVEPKENVLWLDPDGDGGYVSDLSRMFGPDCRMAINLENSLMVTRGTKVVAEAILDNEDRITSISVDERPEGMSLESYFKAIERFMGLKALYRQK